MKTTIMLT